MMAIGLRPSELPLQKVLNAPKIAGILPSVFPLSINFSIVSAIAELVVSINLPSKLLSTMNCPNFLLSVIGSTKSQ